MNLKPRFLLPIIGFALATLTASAQHIQLVTEADIVFEPVFGTHVTTRKAGTTIDTTTPVTSRLTQKQIIESLITNGDIPVALADADKFKLVAVRPAPADVNFVDGEFWLYVISKATPTDASPRLRYPVALTRFSTVPGQAIRNYVERHQGRNVISSSGTVTNYLRVNYTPTFQTPEIKTVVTEGSSRVTTSVARAYTLDTLSTSGYATIGYKTRTVQPIFFCAIDSMRITTLGDFTGTQITTTKVTTATGSSSTTDTDTDPSVPGFGLASMRITLLAAKLVDQRLYPEVPYY